MVLEFQLSKKIKLLNSLESLEQARYLFIFHKDKILCRTNDKNKLIPEFVQTSDGISFSSLKSQLSSLFQQHKWRAFKFANYIDKDCVLIYFKDLTEEDKTETIEINDYQLKLLRSFYNQKPSHWFIIAGLAYQIYQWDIDHIFCGRCGGLFEFSLNEFSKYCGVCGCIIYPQISPAIIILIKKEKKILLAHNTRFPDNMFSLVAGFVNVGETLEECIIREVNEEVGIAIKNIQYIYSQPWPFPNSLMLGFRADWKSGEIVCDRKEISDARWFSIEELSTILLPSSISIARKIIEIFLSQQDS